MGGRGEGEEGRWWKSETERGECWDVEKSGRRRRAREREREREGGGGRIAGNVDILFSQTSWIHACAGTGSSLCPNPRSASTLVYAQGHTHTHIHTHTHTHFIRLSPSPSLPRSLPSFSVRFPLSPSPSPASPPIFAPPPPPPHPPPKFPLPPSLLSPLANKARSPRRPRRPPSPYLARPAPPSVPAVCVIDQAWSGLSFCFRRLGTCTQRLEQTASCYRRRVLAASSCLECVEACRIRLGLRLELVACPLSPLSPLPPLSRSPPLSSLCSPPPCPLP